MSTRNNRNNRQPTNTNANESGAPWSTYSTPSTRTGRERDITASMRKLRRATMGSVAALTGLGFIAGYVPPTYAHHQTITEFVDVKKSAWYYTALTWGLQNHIVSGYEENGTKIMRPENVVTEAEFLAMLIRFFPNSKEEFEGLEKRIEKKQWADNYYGVAKLFNIPMLGNDNVNRRNQPITRGLVAQMIAGAYGKNYDVAGAIAFLYDTDLSKGRSGKTIKGYEADGLMNRAEAVQFLKSINDKKMAKQMQVRDIKQIKNPNTTKYQDSAVVTPPPVKPPVKPPVQPPVQPPAQEGFTVPTLEQLQSFADANGYEVPENYDMSKGFLLFKNGREAFNVIVEGSNRVYIGIRIPGDDALNHAQKILEMYGLPASTVAADMKASLTKGTITKKYGSYNVKIWRQGIVHSIELKK